MVWYYAHEGNRVGPIDDAEFEALLDQFWRGFYNYKERLGVGLYQ